MCSILEDTFYHFAISPRVTLNLLRNIEKGREPPFSASTHFASSSISHGAVGDENVWMLPSIRVLFLWPFTVLTLTFWEEGDWGYVGCSTIYIPYVLIYI